MNKAINARRVIIGLIEKIRNISATISIKRVEIKLAVVKKLSGTRPSSFEYVQTYDQLYCDVLTVSH